MVRMASWIRTVFSGCWGCGLYVSLLSTETIFVNEMLVLHCLFYWVDFRMLLHVCFCSCCTNKRLHNGRQAPLCAEEPVQLSRGIDMSVPHVNANHAWIHGVWVFLPCSLSNHFPWVVKDALRCPELLGASRLPGVL